MERRMPRNDNMMVASLLLLLLAGVGPGPGPTPTRAQLAAKPTRGPHPASPCPSVFSYEGREPDKNRWYGVVLVSTDETLDGLRLNVKLTHRAQILGNFIGDVSTSDNVEFTILNLKMRLDPGPPLPVRIFAAFGDRDDIPYITSIKLNGRTICTSTHPEHSGEVVTRPPQTRLTSAPVIETPVHTPRPTSGSKPGPRPPPGASGASGSVNSYHNNNNNNAFEDPVAPPPQSTPLRTTTTPRPSPVYDHSANVNPDNYYPPSSSNSVNSVSPAFTSSSQYDSIDSTTKRSRRPDDDIYQPASPQSAQGQAQPSYSAGAGAVAGDPEPERGIYRPVPPASREPSREPSRDPPRETSREPAREHSREPSREPPMRETSREPARDVPLQYAVATSTEQPAYKPPPKYNPTPTTERTTYQQPKYTTAAERERDRERDRDTYQPQPQRNRERERERERTTALPRPQQRPTTVQEHRPPPPPPPREDADTHLSTGPSSSSSSSSSHPEPWPTSHYDEHHERPADRPFDAQDAGPAKSRPTRQSTCGTIAPPATPLIINGETSIPGKWPWHVALYKPAGRDWKYQCGGSLVSPTVVVTAAHCVTTNVGRPVAPESLLVFLGKHALRTTSEDGVQDKHVYFIHVHPGYNYTNFRNDIAVLILSSPATITSAVRPVCLWDHEKTDLSHVEGKFGTVVGWRTDISVPEADQDKVVGWGIETDGLLTEELHQALMPVVSPAICVYSYPSFFGVYTNNMTYCAGYSPDQTNAGTSVCNGDSGGGMFFKRDEDAPDDQAVWMLRGLVSLSVRTKQDRCDPSHFVVFTDVAQYVDWLETFVAT